MPKNIEISIIINVIIKIDIYVIITVGVFLVKWVIPKEKHYEAINKWTDIEGKFAKVITCLPLHKWEQNE